jgi:hypothetical protein
MIIEKAFHHGEHGEHGEKQKLLAEKPVAKNIRDQASPRLSLSPVFPVFPVVHLVF